MAWPIEKSGAFIDGEYVSAEELEAASDFYERVVTPLARGEVPKAYKDENK